MGLELYFSNQLELLAEKFATILYQENRQKENILESPLTIVPNANVMKWLQITLAKKQSIFMNIDFHYLESGLWSLLLRLDEQDEKPEMLGNDLMQILVLYALQNLKLKETEFAPLYHYLYDHEGHKGPDYAAKLWQLSARIVHLFHEYEFNRSEMIEGWYEDKEKPEGMERCQQRLYLRMKSLRDWYSRKKGKRYFSMMEYADELLLRENKICEESEKKFVHFFGLSQISAFHLGLMGRLKDFYEMHIYALNPSREFWEDIKTPEEKRWIDRRHVQKLKIKAEEKREGELFYYEDNALLAQWGKPGRESIRLLCELTDYDFHTCFAKEKTASTVLHRVQNDILTLTGEKNNAPRMKQDRSLQISACPGIYREVETLYNSILFNLKEDEKLQLTDIAVLVPDVSKYRPVIDAVFNRKPKALSYNLVDSHAEIESVYGQGILEILALASGRFSRKEVFDLILNPCFMERWHLGPDEIRIWADWVESLNIFHTFDEKSKKARGYEKNNLYTWKQGLQRMRLSRIMSAPDEDCLHISTHFQEIVPFSDVHTDDVNLLEKFCIVIEKLHQSLSDLSLMNSSARKWRQCFIRICDDLLEIPPGYRGETTVKQNLFKTLESLDVYDQLWEEHSETKPDAGFIRELIKTGLRAISGGYGDYLTSGITISSLQPMRPIPFKIVYVLGMEEGEFPGKADMSSLDLRHLKRRIGDISLPERNCYLFLEMLLSVKEKLYISYISKNLQKDRLLQPSSVVNQLRRYVEQEIIPTGQGFKINDIPLKGSSERYVDKNAVNEYSDVMVNYCLSDRTAYYRNNNLWEQVIQRISIEEMEKVKEFFPDFAIDTHRSKSEENEREVERITLKELKRFLEDPVDQSLRRHLGLYGAEESIEEIVMIEDEPFYSTFPLDYNLKIESLRQWLDAFFTFGKKLPDVGNLEAMFEGFYESYTRKSKTPEGAFARLDKAELKEEVYRRADNIVSLMKNTPPITKLYRMIFIGEQSEEHIPAFNKLPIKRFEPQKLTVKTMNSRCEAVNCKTELHGQLPWLWKDESAVWHTLVLTGTGKKPSSTPDKYILGPLLFYILSLCAEEQAKWMGDSKMVFHILYKEEIKDLTYQFDRQSAADYLEQLLSDYLNQKKLEWLPFKAVKAFLKKGERFDDRASESRKEEFQVYLEDAFEEEDFYLTKLVKPQIPSNAFEKAGERFRIFFNTLEQEK